MATELLYFFKVNQFLSSPFQEHNAEKTLSKMIMSPIVALQLLISTMIARSRVRSLLIGDIGTLEVRFKKMRASIFPPKWCYHLVVLCQCAKKQFVKSQLGSTYRCVKAVQTKPYHSLHTYNLNAQVSCNALYPESVITWPYALGFMP